jgi:hypothetical protein
MESALYFLYYIYKTIITELRVLWFVHMNVTTYSLVALNKMMAVGTSTIWRIQVRKRLQNQVRKE